MIATWIRVNIVKKLYLIRKKTNKTTKMKLTFFLESLPHARLIAKHLTCIYFFLLILTVTT